MDIIDISLYASYLLIIVSLVAAIVLPIVKAFDNPKVLVKSGIAFAALVVLFFISYLLSDNGAYKYVAEGALSQAIGGSLVMCYLMVGILVVSLFYSEVSKIFK